MVIFSSSARLLGNRLPKITDSGLYFAKNRPETHFLRDFIIIWLSVELADRAKIWYSHPRFRYWTSVFSDEHASKSNMNQNFPFPGFVLLENNQICTFLRQFVGRYGTSGISDFCCFFKILFSSYKQTVPSHFFDSDGAPNGSWKPKSSLIERVYAKLQLSRAIW